MKPKRDYNRLKTRMDKVRKLHPDWTEEQIEELAINNLLGCAKIE